ncbi:MAG: cytochrome c3 family protein [Phycisphaerales bacterium]|nr:cytochrome c3 family protein [Phycisphaerales bacterium]
MNGVTHDINNLLGAAMAYAELAALDPNLSPETTRMMGQIVDGASLVVGPRRIAMTDPAHIAVNGEPQNCNGCHQIFKSGSPAGAALSFHQDVQLRHGLNDRCVNCHDPENRERLTLRDGTAVSFKETAQLCAQCHGTVYRDWQRGTHGKTLGSWVTGSAAQHRLNCNDCHNPHAPKYEPYVPLPGPNTLRMGNQAQDEHHDDGGKESPLQRWLKKPEHRTPGRLTVEGGHP